MKQNLIYGKISWSYEEQVNCNDLILPVPLFGLNTFKVRGRKIELKFSDKVSFKLLTVTSSKKLPLPQLYQSWEKARDREDEQLGEGRSFLNWMRRNQFSILWKKNDITFHPYFNQTNGWFDPRDNFLIDHAFSIPSVLVGKRKIKLYIKDEDMLQLLHLPTGEESDFLDLVRGYVSFRLEREKTSFPLAAFVDWVNISGKRPLFRKGDLHWDKERYFT